MAFADLLRIPVIGCYAMGSLGLILGLFSRWRVCRKPATWCIAVGFCLHTFLVLALFLGLNLPQMTKGIFLQGMAWSLVLVYCVTWWRLRFSLLGVFAGPLALFLFLLSGDVASISAGLPEKQTAAFFLFHTVVLSLNFSLITLGFGSALFFLSVHKKLKTKSLAPAFDSASPALTTIDRVNAFVVLAGFPLFTLGLLTGFAGAYLTRGHALSGDPKEIASILVWLAYAYGFIQRAVFGAQGKKAARMLLFLFAITLCSLLGVNFFMDSHHNFFRTRLF